MKKTNTFKVMISTLVLAALMSTTAFAAAGQPNLVQGDLTTTSVGSVEQQKGESAAKNVKETGKIESVEKKGTTTTIRIANDHGGLIFHANKGVFVIDQKTGQFASLEDMKVGMTITGIYDKMAPMALSMPGQTSAAIGFVINSDGGSVDLSVYNDELVNWENTLKLNIAKDTKIINAKGTKQVFTGEDLKFSECLVLYGVSTRSIPAQTNPQLVVILNTAKELTADKAKDEKAQTVAYVGLREAAEAKGYKIAWTSNNAPIAITKDDMKATVTIGSDAFTFVHKTKDIKPLDNMKKLDGPAKLEDGKTMVPKTFAEAL
ncbi:MAG: stalk domain-containing protein [Anaerovorax sp.]